MLHIRKKIWLLLYTKVIIIHDVLYDDYIRKCHLTGIHNPPAATIGRYEKPNHELTSYEPLKNRTFNVSDNIISANDVLCNKKSKL